ncbi:hypothetical protein EJB05_36071, partial [Eragrostis curvula]
MSEAAESSRARPVKPDDEEVVGEDTRARKRKWVALAAVPVVVGSKDERAEKIAAGTDVFVDIREPPAPSYLLLPGRVARKVPGRLPRILATHSSGRLLFHATAASEDGVDATAGYFLCDGRARTATRLPAVPVARLGVDLAPDRTIGLLSDPRHAGQYVVAQLHAAAGIIPENMLYYSTNSGEWEIKQLVGAASPDHQAWGAQDVSEDGNLWCVDADHGCILSCDAFAEHPQLRQLPFPFGRDNQPVVRAPVARRQYVGVSEGSLRYVEIGGSKEKPAVRGWTYRTGAEAAGWQVEYNVPLEAIWSGKGGRSAMRKKDHIEVQLIDPTNRHVVYFSVGKKLFQVEVPAHRVMKQLYMTDPCQIVAWELPPSLFDAHSEFVLTDESAADEGPMPLVPNSNIRRLQAEGLERAPDDTEWNKPSMLVENNRSSS